MGTDCQLRSAAERCHAKNIRRPGSFVPFPQPFYASATCLRAVPIAHCLLYGTDCVRMAMQAYDLNDPYAGMHKLCFTGMSSKCCDNDKYNASVCTHNGQYPNNRETCKPLCASEAATRQYMGAHAGMNTKATISSNGLTQARFLLQARSTHVIRRRLASAWPKVPL